MKIKRKGKVHPSPPQVGSQDHLSVLNLLPAAILAFAAVLSLQDREVLAYMITRSLKTTTTSSIASSSSSVQESKKFYRNNRPLNHKLAMFDCECFDCYTSFWYRWDSSPNRELIHQAIEAFEEHLASGEVQTKRSGNRRGKKKEKPPVQKLEMAIQISNPVVEPEASQLQIDEALPEILDSTVAEVNLTPVPLAEEEEAVPNGHKGFARKVLPGVFGVLNSRLWNLWGPNC
ncbi:unnamed protein product [Rhodiola kirilowii]